MNPIRPDKLLQSKWTALAPLNKERHFMVVKLVDIAHQRCQIEAVLTKKRYIIDWHDLTDSSVWQIGWQ